MNTSIYEYSYKTQLPYMFTCISMVYNSKPGSNGLTKEQDQLWATVIDNRDRVLQNSPHRDGDPAMQQYMLELWSWNRFWPEKQFPGSEPKMIDIENDPSQFSNPTKMTPSDDSTRFTHTPFFSPLVQQYPFNTDPRFDSGVESYDRHAHSSSLSPTHHYPPIKPPSEEEIRAECREAIMQHKGADHVPYHGWDAETGLPLYSVVCTASNGFLVFCGPQAQYYRLIKNHFLSTARIMYQRVRTGLMIVWIEAPTKYHTSEFRTNKRLWNEFKGCRAFLKCWADAAGEGPADKIGEFLQGWRADYNQFEELQMPFPPLRVFHKQAYLN